MKTFSKSIDFYQKENKLEKPTILKYAIISTLVIFCYEYLLVDPLAMYFGVDGLDKGFSNSGRLDIVSALLLAPVLEELLSRGFLSGKRKHFIFLFIQPFLGMLIFGDYWWLFLGIGIGFLVWVIHEQNQRPDDIYLSKPLFYASFIFTTLVFTLLHLGNVESSSSTLDWTFTILGIMPGAILFGWVRYQAGLGYAMLTHGIFNLLTLSLNEALYL